MGYFCSFFFQKKQKKKKKKKTQYRLRCVAATLILQSVKSHSLSFRFRV